MELSISMWILYICSNLSIQFNVHPNGISTFLLFLFKEEDTFFFGWNKKEDIQ